MLDKEGTHGDCFSLCTVNEMMERIRSGKTSIRSVSKVGLFLWLINPAV